MLNKFGFYPTLLLTAKKNDLTKIQNKASEIKIILMSNQYISK